MDALADKTIKTVRKKETKIFFFFFNRSNKVAAGGSCTLALTHDGVCYMWGWMGAEEAMRFVTPAVVEGPCFDCNSLLFDQLNLCVCSLCFHCLTSFLLFSVFSLFKI